MLWNNPLYTRNEIDAARPIITEIAGYTLVRIFSKRYNDWVNKPCIVRYDDLYAWHHWEK